MATDRPTNEEPVFVDPQAPPSLDTAAVDKAVLAYKPIKRASRIALMSAVVTLLIGAACLPFIVFSPSFSAAFIIVGILAVGVMEFMGYKNLQQADPTAPWWLARNQLIFLGLIVIYCAWQMLGTSTAELKAEAISPEVRAQLIQLPGSLDDIDRFIDRYGMLLVCGFYGLVIVLSIAFQGGMALYYHTRRKFVEAFLSQPTWVRSLVLKASA